MKTYNIFIIFYDFFEALFTKNYDTFLTPWTVIKRGKSAVEY